MKRVCVRVCVVVLKNCVQELCIVHKRVYSRRQDSCVEEVVEKGCVVGKGSEGEKERGNNVLVNPLTDH